MRYSAIQCILVAACACLCVSALVSLVGIGAAGFRCSGRVRIVITTLPLMQQDVVTSFTVGQAEATWGVEGV
jgi:hypothetical protein